MARLPQPPTAAALKSLLRVDEDIVAVHSGTRLVRIFNAGGGHPQQWNAFRTFGPLPHGRFDQHPLGPRGAPASQTAPAR